MEKELRKRRAAMSKMSHSELMDSIFELEARLERAEYRQVSHDKRQMQHYQLLEKILDDFGIRAKGLSIGKSDAELRLEEVKQQLQRALGYIDRINEDQPISPLADSVPSLGPKISECVTVKMADVSSDPSRLFK